MHHLSKEKKRQATTIETNACILTAPSRHLKRNYDVQGQAKTKTKLGMIFEKVVDDEDKTLPNTEVGEDKST